MSPLTRREFLGEMLAWILAPLSTGLAVLAGFGLFKARPPKTFSQIFPVENPHVREAKWWRTVCAGVQCVLCPIQCFLPEGARGVCRVRANSGGRLVTLVYEHPVSVHIDPIEKKPVFHLLPGSWIYSLATAGCNLRCSFCQNWEISQIFPEEAQAKTLVPTDLRLFPSPEGRLYAQPSHVETQGMSAKDVVEAAIRTRCVSIAYTYSEPIIFYEYVFDIAEQARKRGLLNVMVSAGYINPEPLRAIAPLVDIFKVDLKGFNEKFYRDVVKGELKFVLRSLVELKKNNVLAEIVNLVVPTLNDDPDEIRRMCKWIKENLGPDEPVFFSRFTPQYRLQNLPPTPVETLTRAREAAMAEGLRYAYVGNVPGHAGENTFCPRCRQTLVRRHGYAVLENRITPKGTCPADGTQIPGIWSYRTAEAQAVNQGA